MNGDISIVFHQYNGTRVTYRFRSVLVSIEEIVFVSEKLFLIAWISFFLNGSFYSYHKYLFPFCHKRRTNCFGHSSMQSFGDLFARYLCNSSKDETLSYVNLFADTHFCIARHVALCRQLSNNKYCSWIICYWLALS